jgi:hypothetical protein
MYNNCLPRPTFFWVWDSTARYIISRNVDEGTTFNDDLRTVWRDRHDNALIGASDKVVYNAALLRSLIAYIDAIRYGKCGQPGPGILG